MSVAVLVDAAFFIKRFSDIYPGVDKDDPLVVGEKLCSMCWDHVKYSDIFKEENAYLYRILVYDCRPLNKTAVHPIHGGEVDFSKIKGSLFRLAFHEYLKRQRKVALRLGELSSGAWIIKPRATSKLIKRKVTVDDLSSTDVKYDIKQKGVDMRIGLDIASLSLKGKVDQIILISGDSDFVPAAKMARREGIDFVLDPLWSTFIKKELFEHIDGVKSVVPRPKGYTSPVYGN